MTELEEDTTYVHSRRIFHTPSSNLPRFFSNLNRSISIRLGYEIINLDQLTLFLFFKIPNTHGSSLNSHSRDPCFCSNSTYSNFIGSTSHSVIEIVATPLSALPDFMMLGAQEGISLPNVS